MHFLHLRKKKKRTNYYKNKCFKDTVSQMFVDVDLVVVVFASFFWWNTYKVKLNQSFESAFGKLIRNLSFDG